MAFCAFCWLAYAKASWSSREISKRLATFSAVMPIGVYASGIRSMASGDMLGLLPVMGTSDMDSTPPAMAMSCHPAAM